jgi:hypothetical protein
MEPTVGITLSHLGRKEKKNQPLLKTEYGTNTVVGFQ